jgi:SAM-dependent methyltransferase
MRLHDNRNWSVYHTEYAKQIEDLKNEHDLWIVDLGVDGNNELIFENNQKELHNNWKDLYNIVYRLGVSSAFEVGCGSGQHLYNLYQIYEGWDCFKLGGCDINYEQIQFGKDVLELPNEVYENVRVLDFTRQDIPQIVDKYDIVYSQAVLMHLSHHNALAVLKNMYEVSNKYIVLVENSNDHINEELVKELGLNVDISYPTRYETQLCLITKL